MNTHVVGDTRTRGTLLGVRTRRPLLIVLVVSLVVLLAVATAVIVRKVTADDDTPVAHVSGTSARTADSWVTKSGSGLTLDAQPWRFTGVNMYWLGLDDNVRDDKGPTYPTHALVDNGLNAAVKLGARVVRSTTLGVSVGSPRSVEPTLGHVNKAAFDSIDYAVAAARKRGLRLMIPLTDQWHYYEGGKHTFTAWRGHADLPGQTVATGEQRDIEYNFYTDPTVIADFHRYISTLLDHVNPLTGLRLGDDPTIAIWETGNELWDAPPTWTEQTAAYIKTQAPRALVADGSVASGAQVDANARSDLPHVDIIDAHYYPRQPDKARADAQLSVDNGKVYIVGEYPLSGSGLASWLAQLAQDQHVAGDLAWSLLPQGASGEPEPHSDGYTFHYPGANAAETAQDTLFIAHARSVNRT